MIFVTVGSQMAFDRLVAAVDAWAGRRMPALDVFAQIGPSSYQPRTLRYAQALSPAEFNATVAKADIIVAHAGMGSVLTAMELGKSLVLMPRRGDLQETRNDHQIATAHWLAGRPGIFIAMDEGQLGAALEAALAAGQRTAAISPYASPSLLSALREFVA